MANYIYTNNGLINADELKHWKYVKRERVGDTWRYYYSDDEYQNAKRKNDSLKKDYDDGTKLKNLLTKKIDETRKKAESDGEITTDEYIDIRVREEVLKKINKVHIELGKKYVQSNEKFKKIKNKTLPRRTIAKGAAAVANFFEKTKKKLKGLSKKAK
jgi:hypothetical protein